MQKGNLEKIPDHKSKNYRTKRRAGPVCEIPQYVPAITNKKYQNAMTLNVNDVAYIQAINMDKINLYYKNGQSYLQGLPATSAKLKNYYAKENIEQINIFMLRIIYGIILMRFEKTWSEDQVIEEVVTIYYPDLAKAIGKASNIGNHAINECIDLFKSFQNIWGLVNKGENGKDILPVIVYIGYDSSKNTISFSSPYMVRIISEIYNTSIKKDHHGKTILKSNGEPKLNPAYSYMIRASIVKERNKRAVEVVFIVVTLIEQCGNNEPHIRAQTIIDRNPALKKSISGCDFKRINTLLQRTFKKAWELLNTQTTLREHYQNIALPDLSAADFKKIWIPTSNTCDRVFKFPHEGKK